MKLYATTTSERASKGQGGNHLNISITDKNKKVLMSIEARIVNEIPTIEVLDYTKGKRQKGEKCIDCNEIIDDTKNCISCKHKRCLSCCKNR